MVHCRRAFADPVAPGACLTQPRPVAHPCARDLNPSARGCDLNLKKAIGILALAMIYTMYVFWVWSVRAEHRTELHVVTCVADLNGDVECAPSRVRYGAGRYPHDN